MSTKLCFDIARTHLITKKKQTLIAMLGVTFGIGLYIAMIGLMTGLNDFTLELTNLITPDLHVYHDIGVSKESVISEVYPTGLNVLHHPKPKREKRNLKDAFQLMNLLRQHEKVEAVAPQLRSQVFYNYGPVDLNGTIIGVDILLETQLFDVESKIKEGKMTDLISTQDAILMGSGLAKKLNAVVGDRITITTPEGFIMKLKIVGIFQYGMGAVDDIFAYASMSTVQKILQKDKNYITDINVQLTNHNEAQALAPFFENLLGYKTEDWETANATTQLGVTFRNILTYAVSITLLIVAGFGIYNILNMTIYNKMKDIAILKAIGFAGNDVKLIFMIQALIIGLAGGLGGLGLGYLLSYLISIAPFDGGDVINIKHLPVNFDTIYYVMGIVFGLLTTGLAGWLPSKMASKVDPIEIIRGQ